MYLDLVNSNLGAMLTVLDNIDSGTGSIISALASVNMGLESIYTRLHDVIIDSFVNVRVMDEFGALPITATAGTGLLVSAFASAPTIDVNVINSPLNVGGTASNPVYVATTPFEPFQATGITNPVVVHPQLLAANSTPPGVWVDQVGVAGTSVEAANNSGITTFSVTGCAPVALTSGVNLQSSMYDIGVVNALPRTVSGVDQFGLETFTPT